MALSNKWKPIVEELLTWMSEDQIIETLTEKKIEENLEFDTNFLYMVARDQKKYRLLDYLVKEQDLKRHFLRLPKLLEEKRYDLLPIPISFFYQDGIDDLLDSDTVESAREHKLFMDLANKYGTIFVNNLFQISLLNNKSKQSPKLDSISKLDHSLEINPFYEFNKKCYLKLLDYYSLERVFKLMLSSSFLGEFIEEDVILLFKEMESLSKEIQSQVLPKKPKNLKKLHDDLSKALISHTKMGISLDQELSYLDGAEMEGFTIEVPKISDDLVSTSIELDHCVHTYIHHVKNGLCCIINLKHADKRVYTVELEKSEGDEFSIVQFKGFKNEDSMEGVKGELMRNKILSLIKAQSIMKSALP